jgi:hypothetical protein
MIINFEEITIELNQEEMKLLPILIRGFKDHPKSDPVKAPQIIKRINEKRLELGLTTKFTEPRLRKLCNYIRSNALLPLIATSDGYYVSNDSKEISLQIVSLKERAGAILNSARGLEIYLMNHGENDR